MAVAFLGYYDGTGSPANSRRGEIIGLGGYAASPEVWTPFEAEWWRVLADDSQRPACRYMHMREARALRGEFSQEKGGRKSASTPLLGISLIDAFRRMAAMT